MEIKKLLEKVIHTALSDFGNEGTEVVISNSSGIHGDFTTNIAMRLGGNPIENAEKIKKIIEQDEIVSRFEKIEVVRPGFINFFLSQEEIVKQCKKALAFSARKEDRLEDLILEFGDLNPFKEPHLGHVRNLVLGEALSRLKEATGVNIIRANYEGDVGMHVAKCIWGIIQSKEFDQVKEKSLEDRARFLGKAYSVGAKAFEEDENAKIEITEINIKIYQKDSQVIEIWEKGRAWSLEYFEELYNILGVKYKKYYFESETAPVGKEIVEKNIDKVFTKDDGAIIFRGEDFGLHTRVFITKENNVTYEGKDLALAVMKDKDFPEASSLIMTANEQAEYFKVLLKALELTDEDIAKKTSHLSYGFINLKEGKMSSRTGNVVSAFWLIDETKKRLKEGFREVPDSVLEQLAVASVKWAMLKFSRESNITFSIEESIQIEGNSGPYMLYTYARTQSLLEKAQSSNFEANIRENLDPELVALLRLVCQFEIIVNDSSGSFSPNILTNYLYDLAQHFNKFYEKEKIVGSEKENEKMAVVNAVGFVLKNGLYLLGIEAPSKI